MYLTKAMEDYLRHSQDELKALIRDLCAIPAPSHQEDARAAYVRDWLEQAGGRPEIDEAKNVICPLGDDDGDGCLAFQGRNRLEESTGGVLVGGHGYVRVPEGRDL